MKIYNKTDGNVRRRCRPSVCGRRNKKQQYNIIISNLSEHTHTHAYVHKYRLLL